jgi:hypothetical protein
MVIAVPIVPIKLRICTKRESSDVLLLLISASTTKHQSIVETIETAYSTRHVNRLGEYGHVISSSFPIRLAFSATNF